MEHTEQIALLTESIEKVIIGKSNIIRMVINAMLCGGHILIEDVPGVGKTQMVAALAKSLGGKFNRIQLTPDIMPSDIVGFSMVNQQSGALEYHEGAAMCNFLLADEINRASPKSQSSLLEVMEEFQISLDGITHNLPRPFMVLATQNPVETYGTFHLPEAQMDRFFMRISMGYPEPEEEISILERTQASNPIVNIEKPVLRTDDILELQKLVTEIRVSRQLKEYIVTIVNATRNNDRVNLGVSPRGSISLYKAAKANAFSYGRDFVIPDDIKAVAPYVLAHRIILSPKGKSIYHTAYRLVDEILDSVEIPM